MNEYIQLCQSQSLSISIFVNLHSLNMGKIPGKNFSVFSLRLVVFDSLDESKNDGA